MCIWASRAVADPVNRLRVALVAGSLAQGGAEKQLVYHARALLGAGANVRIYSLTRGEYYESALQAIGLAPIWVGRFGSPGLRLPILAAMLRHFRPHVIQSTHEFVNLYVGLAARLVGAISVGAMRSSLPYSCEENGIWARWLINSPAALLANSKATVQELIRSKLIDPQRLYLVPNVIELSDFGNGESPEQNVQSGQPQDCKAVFVGRLIPTKRLDRFLRALALACEQHSALRGTVVGDGPERKAMEDLAARLGLWPHKVTFLGQRDDVPMLLKQSDMLVLCSDKEGFPNVLLEAMATRLPIVTTPAGDARTLVQEGINGFLVPFDDANIMAERMVRLARSPGLRRQLGNAGRWTVEQNYGYEGLPSRLLLIYRQVALRFANSPVVNILEAMSSVAP